VVVEALRGVDLEITAGEHVAIVGRSGSGKSTLLALLAGLDRPSSGTVEVAGHELSRLDGDALARYRREQIGIIFQSFNLIATMTACENVALPLAFAGVAATTRLARAQDVLARVGLAHRAGHRPSELSGGEQQRVAVARALVARPQLLLADEPTGNLDSTTAGEILDLIDGLHAEGLTVVMVTHDEAAAQARCDRLVRLVDGEVAA
jgi:putative ABC transport system ATP-binding protein